MSPSTVGARSELLAAAHLMECGYHVFRAMSPSATCDLIITKPGQQMIRVEVRTGYPRATGGISYPYAKKDHGRSDWVSVVVGDKVRFFVSGPCNPGTLEIFPQLDQQATAGQGTGLDAPSLQNVSDYTEPVNRLPGRRKAQRARFKKGHHARIH